MDSRLHAFNGGFRRRVTPGTLEARPAGQNADRRSCPPDAAASVRSSAPLGASGPRADRLHTPIAGEMLATFESVAVLLALFSSFDLAFAPDYLATTPMIQTPLCAEPTPQYRHSLTMPMAQPLRVVATRRVES